MLRLGGFLVMLCVLIAFLTIPLLRGPMRTTAGRRLLHGRRQKNPKPYGRMRDYDTAVAIWGLDGLHGHPDATALRMCFANASASGDGGGH